MTDTPPKSKDKSMFALRKALLVVLLAAIGQSGPASAQAVSSDKLIATIVIAKIPPGVPRAKLDEGIAASVPTYQKIPGLLAKFFTVNADSYGGMYLWADRASAEAWFTPEFVAKVKARSGVEPQIIYFESPIQLDNRAAFR
jgi:hypothetical protein